MANNRVIFDAGPIAGGTVFAAPLAIIRADGPGDVARAFADIRQAQSDGYWLAGYASYELGYCLDAKLNGLMPSERQLPLMLFGVFDRPVRDEHVRTTQPAVLAPLEPEVSANQYRERFERALEYIRAGDIYQVNLTFALQGVCTADPDDLFAALRTRQAVPHGAMVDLGGPVILSRSPELFLQVDRDGTIETRPMKGTAPRSDIASEDEALRSWLASSEKNRAENLMIVDLLRNDISKVAKVGTVAVPELFKIETYATVHQMTSTVRGSLLAGVGLEEIFRALFPCGSITGAPKIRAMEIIAELETGPRGVYCGAVGWLGPDGRMSFNVAIRTLILQQNGGLTLNVGGGIVYDSTARSEYDEALLKARFSYLPG